uniref:Uncharacterized protein n=1 Tax=Panagrolaimus sp. PS1159 TaxID=55785 RepID=A0AC35EWN7_9BILA
MAFIGALSLFHTWTIITLTTPFIAAGWPWWWLFLLLLLLLLLILLCCLLAWLLNQKKRRRTERYISGQHAPLLADSEKSVIDSRGGLFF